MKNKLNFIIVVLMTILFASCAQPGGGGYGSTGSSGGGGIFSTLIFLGIIAVIVIAAVKAIKKEESFEITPNQTNKVVNVTLTGGLIGMFGSSPQNRLNKIIKKENANGWRVVQVIPADSGNIFLALFRLLLLIITLFLYTTSNGYYVIMERVPDTK